jgi:Superinfection immunity protein
MNLMVVAAASAPQVLAPEVKGLTVISSLLLIAALGIMTTGSVALYLLPLVIGLARRVPDIEAVAAVNVLLGWTFVGWVAAMAMALRSARPVSQAVQFVQNFPPQPPLAQWAGAGWAGPPGPPLPRPGTPPPLAIPPRPADYLGYVGHPEQG